MLQLEPFWQVLQLLMHLLLLWLQLLPSGTCDILTVLLLQSLLQLMRKPLLLQLTVLQPLLQQPFLLQPQLLLKQQLLLHEFFLLGFLLLLDQLQMLQLPIQTRVLQALLLRHAVLLQLLPSFVPLRGVAAASFAQSFSEDLMAQPLSSGESTKCPLDDFRGKVFCLHAGDGVDLCFLRRRHALTQNTGLCVGGILGLRGNERGLLRKVKAIWAVALCQLRDHLPESPLFQHLQFQVPLELARKFKDLGQGDGANPLTPLLRLSDGLLRELSLLEKPPELRIQGVFPLAQGAAQLRGGLRVDKVTLPVP
mmetsp:Transcript_49148/g.137626  ORF Transcript_49148/g.137626 Transcript_49148/m.137626 type:complete len:309 (+) Transcript_49148:197-1123(+)